MALIGDHAIQTAENCCFRRVIRTIGRLEHKKQFLSVAMISESRIDDLLKKTLETKLKLEMGRYEAWIIRLQ